MQTVSCDFLLTCQFRLNEYSNWNHHHRMVVCVFPTDRKILPGTSVATSFFLLMSNFYSPLCSFSILIRSVLFFSLNETGRLENWMTCIYLLIVMNIVFVLECQDPLECPFWNQGVKTNYNSKLQFCLFRCVLQSTSWHRPISCEHLNKITVL